MLLQKQKERLKNVMYSHDGLSKMYYIICHCTHATDISKDTFHIRGYFIFTRKKKDLCVARFWPNIRSHVLL